MEISNLEVKNYPDFLTLYNEAFPPEQRRAYTDEQHLARFIKEKGGKFHAIAAKEGDIFLGFLSYWTFERYIYIEHFAVDAAHRGKNIGTLMLQHVINTVSPDVLIEVEHPDSKEARDRIRFYERNGFRTREEIDYTQPPYSPELEPVSLLLMTHGDVKLDSTADMKEMLREVYNLNIGA